MENFMKMTGIIVLVAGVLVALLIAGCQSMFRSDSSNAIRQWKNANAQVLAGSKEASRQSAGSVQIKGHELVELLTGYSMVREYVKHSGDSTPYFTSYEYFGPGGKRVMRDTYSLRAPGYEEKSRWRLDGDVLCVFSLPMGQPERCHTLRRAADGRIQFWHHKPGDPYDGLVESSVKRILPGLQEPEFITPPDQMRR
jgi:outer membrane murein-binding lipoprotein Lpp